MEADLVIRLACVMRSFTRLLEKKPPMQSRNQCLARFWSTVLALIPQPGWLKCDARTPRHIGRDRRSSSPAASTLRRSHGWPQRRPAEAEGCGSSLPRIALRGSSRGAYGKRESSSFCRNSRTSARPLVGGQHQRLAVARISFGHGRRSGAARVDPEMVCWHQSPAVPDSLRRNDQRLRRLSRSGAASPF
jgi:hypothetical protein